MVEPIHIIMIVAWVCAGSAFVFFLGSIYAWQDGEYGDVFANVTLGGVLFSVADGLYLVGL